MRQTSHGFAAEIHKRSRLSQQQLLAPHFANAHFSLVLPVVKVDRMKLGKVIQAQKANIMAITGISLAGITQTNYEFH
jgi:hypothetical protein